MCHILMLSAERKDAVCSDARPAVEISDMLELINVTILILITFVSTYAYQIFSNRDVVYMFTLWYTSKKKDLF